MSIFGTTPDEAAASALDIETVFTLHTAIDCIRYGEKSAGFLPDLPTIDAAKVIKYAYSVIMRFEDNFCESFQDEQGTWQTRGKGQYSLTTPLYNRLKNQTDAAIAYTHKVFKTGALTNEKLQRVLDFVQKGATCPIETTEGFKFSEQELGMKEYISFQTNVAIGQCIRVFKATGTRNMKKSSLSASLVDDLVTLTIYEKGQMPVPATPEAGEIISFMTDTTDVENASEIEVEETDLYPLTHAQDLLAVWWNTFDKGSDKRNLIDIMVKEAREYLQERAKNPPTAGFVMADAV